jgi:hypothetical protein
MNRSAAMTTMTLGDATTRQTPARGVMRRALARMLASREHKARREVKAYLLGLDDATLATYGIDRSALDMERGYPF